MCYYIVISSNIYYSFCITVQTGLIPDAIENKCADCSEKQKLASEKVIKYLYENKNDMWKELEAKYDPQGTYKQRYAEDAKRLNIKV
jgi:hypothetical protein